MSDSLIHHIYCFIHPIPSLQTYRPKPPLPLWHPRPLTITAAAAVPLPPSSGPQSAVQSAVSSASSSSALLAPGLLSARGRRRRPLWPQNQNPERITAYLRPSPVAIQIHTLPRRELLPLLQTQAPRPPRALAQGHRRAPRARLSSKAHSQPCPRVRSNIWIA